MFKKVFYIVQTKPKLQVCGYSFNKLEARYVADCVKRATGKRGKIIEFTRDELVGLDYAER